MPKRINMEKITKKYDNNVAYKALIEFINVSKRNDLRYFITQNSITDLYEMYVVLRGTKDEELFIKILKKYGFNFSHSILNSIGSLLGNVSYDDPLEWPGIVSIDNDSDKYILHTLIGDIEVFRASDIFKGTKSSYIFNKDLIHQCFNRTYDFVCENNDYDVVASLINNSFRGGFYHAYAVKDNILVDPALNAIYFNPEVISKLYKGIILERITFDEVKKRISKIKKYNPNMDDNSVILSTFLHQVY